ncbi:17-beta-hydroxysteroid dehydrogenase 13-like isoform X1 [Frieseomelitta varia]|uniref:17-beta-hydroxysteroid dehydrogenase 13-like isoform X1 n=1 Tax=Frieseomelitta varia TaxID=561572 RepID=UPI001CB69E22|nr:17-beta-hydroxysteroid dehydrogenase 13-like isoform X1 [Frieseomelitta varia]
MIFNYFCIKMESLRNIFKPPKMMLKMYFLIILILDLWALLFKIFYATIIALYRIFRPPPLKDLTSEVAMVVGAGQGIGREMAIHLCKLHVKVACIDINKDDCNTTVQLALSQLIGIARVYICNITDENEVARVVNAIQVDLGDVTMLFHCCSIPSPKVLCMGHQPVPKIKHTINRTILSHFWLLDKVLPSMARAGRGHIVVLSSVAGLFHTTPGRSRIPLSAAQFAVQGLAKSIHTEARHSNTNITVTLVHVYPFIVGAEVKRDIRFRIPSFFGTVSAKEAAKQILDGVRRNYLEFSVPGYIFYLSNISRIFPKEVLFLVRDFLDTGVDFG